MKIEVAGAFMAALFAGAALGAGAAATNRTEIADLGNVTVEGAAVSKYRPETVNGGTFTDVAPENLPVVVDAITSDFIQEHNPTDLHDLLRFVPGIETGGKSLLVRQPGTFSIRGMGGAEPMFDGVMPVGRGPGLFMDTFLLDRVEIVKGPIASLAGGAGASQNANGGGGSVNMYLKSASLDRDFGEIQENTSIGRRTQRHRGMADLNETFLDGKGAVRVVGTADYYEPTYVNEGAQKGARPRESFALAPSVVFAPAERVKFGMKTLFQYTDQPSHIGVPVWRGRPGNGYSWYESSCRRGDRSKYESFMLNPWLDFQATDDWLIKFGASMMVSSWEQTTREPYYTTGLELDNYYATGRFSSGNKYVMSNFSQSESVSRNYNLFVRSIYDREARWGIRNALVVQGDYNYREADGGFGTPCSRYGATLQDAVSWKWVTLLAGIRYDRFEQDSYTSATVNQRTRATTYTRYWHESADAVSPRAGLSVKPLDWLVFFGNLSQTRTPMLGLRNADGSTPSDPWRATQYEGGVRVRPFGENGNLWLTASAYRIEQENVPEADSDTGFYTYDGRNKSRGAELSLSGDITDSWTVMAMYAFNKYTDRNVAHGQPGRDFARHPEHSFSFNTSYRFGFSSRSPLSALNDVVASAGYRFRSTSYATWRGAYVDEHLKFAPSHVFDLSFAIPLSKFGGGENWTLTLGVRNLFGEKYFESARHYHECLVGEPRTFELGIRVRF